MNFPIVKNFPLDTVFECLNKDPKLYELLGPEK